MWLQYSDTRRLREKTGCSGHALLHLLRLNKDKALSDCVLKSLYLVLVSGVTDISFKMSNTELLVKRM